MPEDQPFTEQQVQQRYERIGRELVGNELYAEAIEEYKDLVRDYPRSRWTANALMGIAECFHHLGQTDEELRTLEAVADQFPDHIVAKRAQAALRLLRGSEASPPPPELGTATAFSRQARRLRQTFLCYSIVGWALSLVLLVLVVRLSGGVAGLNARLTHLESDYASLKAGSGVAASPSTPRPAPVRAPGPARRPAAPAPSAAARPAVAPPAPPAPAAAPSARGGAYTVKSGDTLWTIAKRQLGDARRVNEIAALNGLKEPYRLRVGEKLKLPK
jgi:LysM repeat protein